MFSHWQGDGYNEGNKDKDKLFYFYRISANERHNFNFLLTGAPQWHDQNFTKALSIMKNMETNTTITGVLIRVNT